MTDRVVPNAPKGVATLSEGVLCSGCGERFQPARKGQQHCRARCRLLAFERRQHERRGEWFEADPGRPE